MRQLFATNDFINPKEFMTLYIKQIFQKKRSKMLDSLIQNQTSFSSNMVPVGIKSLVVKGMVMIGMQNINFLWNLDTSYQRQNKPLG